MLGAAILVVGVIWSFVLAAVAVRRSGWSAKAYLVAKPPRWSASATIMPSASDGGITRLVSHDHEPGEMHRTEIVLRCRELGHQRRQVPGSALALAGPLIGKSIMR